jgi:hypothetical protein
MPHDRIRVLIKRKPGSPIHSPYIRTQQDGSHLYTRKRALTRNWPCWHPDLELPASTIVENKCLLLKLPSYSSPSKLRHAFLLTAWVKSPDNHIFLHHFYLVVKVLTIAQLQHGRDSPYSICHPMLWSSLPPSSKWSSSQTLFLGLLP